MAASPARAEYPSVTPHLERDVLVHDDAQQLAPGRGAEDEASLGHGVVDRDDVDLTHEVVGKLSLGINPDEQPRWG